MDNAQTAMLNQFFVETFNDILGYEERYLKRSGVRNLSVRELHILEAVSALAPQGKNTMSATAKRLSISVGALTTAVGTLVRKGFLRRAGRENDRRVVVLELTDTGRGANEKHGAFHGEMIRKVGEILDPASIQNLCQSLSKLSEFFKNPKNESK